MKDIIVFSHLRWDSVFQRPQHIMTELAENYNIIFIEEELVDEENDRYISNYISNNIWVIQPYLQERNHINDTQSRMRTVLGTILDKLSIKDYIAWYYSPMSFAFSSHLRPVLTVYDCMDEQSAFLHGPPELIKNELELRKVADYVFTNSNSLSEIKKTLYEAEHSVQESNKKGNLIKDIRN